MLTAGICTSLETGETDYSRVARAESADKVHISLQKKKRAGTDVSQPSMADSKHSAPKEGRSSLFIGAERT